MSCSAQPPIESREPSGSEKNISNEKKLILDFAIKSTSVVHQLFKQKPIVLSIVQRFLAAFGLNFRQKFGCNTCGNLERPFAKIQR